MYLTALLLLAAGGGVHAQNRPAPPPPAGRSTNAETHIDSQRAEFDLTARRAVYAGNVRVNDPQLQLTCEQLTAVLPQSGGHINHLVALTNVVMDSVDDKGGTNHATSDMAVYDYSVENGVTNEIITLSGHAVAENAQITLYGEPIKYDRATGNLSAMNQRMVIKQRPMDMPPGAGPPATSTNPAAAEPSGTRPPAAKTNFPPGTISNIDLMVIPPGP